MVTLCLRLDLQGIVIFILHCLKESIFHNCGKYDTPILADWQMGQNQTLMILGNLLHCSLEVRKLAHFISLRQTLNIKVYRLHSGNDIREKFALWVNASLYCAMVVKLSLQYWYWFSYSEAKTKWNFNHATIYLIAWLRYIKCATTCGSQISILQEIDFIHQTI